MKQAFATTRRRKRYPLILAVFSLVNVIAIAAQTPASDRGQVIVRASCETCHSLAPGVVKIGPSLFALLNGPAPRSTPKAVKQIIQHGRNNRMPAYGELFTESELESIVQYLRQLQ